MTSRQIATLFCTTALAGLVPLGAALAQQAPAAPPAPANTGQLEEIVVTARKTAEALQTTPVSITAITAAKLEAQNVTSPTALNGLAPNLNITQGAGYATALNVTIRGVNQADNVLTNDAPVALYIDGVYNGRQMGGQFDLVDLERVEVLRGPQGTLFGRNTTGGAINFITRGPSDKFGIEEKVAYGRFRDFRSRTEVNTGLIGGSNIKALLAYSHHQNDGYVRNTLRAKNDGFGSLASNAFYANLHADVTDQLSLDYKIDYTHMKDQPLASVLTTMSPVNLAFFGSSPNFGGAPLVISNTRRSSQAVFDANPNVDEFYGHAFTINYEASDALHLKSITAYRSFADDSHDDQAGQDNLLGPVLGANGIEIQHISPFTTLCPGNTPNFRSNICDHQRQYQWSEELQATGTIDEFKYAAGLFYFSEHVSETDPEFLTIAVPTAGATGAAVLQGFGIPAAFIPFIQSDPRVIAANNTLGFQAYPVTNYKATSKSYAAYGQASYRPHALDDKVEITGGLRYTKDKKTIQQRDFSADNPGVFSNFFDGGKSWHNISWLGSASYQFTPDVMAYAKVSSAYKSGGFSARTHANQYEPEKATSFEGGIKSEFFDRHVRVNGDVFYTKYDDAQINVFVQDPVTHAAASVTTNAGKLTYTGFELEASVVPERHVLIDGSIGYTHPHFKQFLTAIPPSTTLVNLADQAIVNYASKTTWAIGGQYTFDPFSFGTLSARVDYNYASPKTFHPLTVLSPLNPIIKSGHYHNLNAYVLLSDIDTQYGTWQAKLYGSNLLGEAQRYAGIDFEIVSGLSYFGNNSYNPPRQYGIELTFKFAPG